MPQQKSEVKKLQSLSMLPYLLNFSYRRKKLQENEHKGERDPAVNDFRIIFHRSLNRKELYELPTYLNT